MIMDKEEASAKGILRCLQMLAEEAALLNLRQTVSAIETALETIAVEGDNRIVVH